MTCGEWWQDEVDKTMKFSLAFAAVCVLVTTGRAIYRSVHAENVRHEQLAQQMAAKECRLWMSTANTGKDSLKVYLMLPRGLFGPPCSEVLTQ